MKRKYTIRREMLCMTRECWKKWDELFPGETESVSPDEILERVGLISGKSAMYNNEEKVFFEELYRIWRIANG